MKTVKYSEYHEAMAKLQSMATEDDPFEVISTFDRDGIVNVRIDLGIASLAPVDALKAASHLVAAAQAAQEFKYNGYKVI